MSASLKIRERKGQLGLHLINHEGEFFLFGKALVAMWRNRGRHVLVKHHNADTKSAIAYHPGQVVGLIEEGTVEVTVRIYKGGVGKTIGLDAESIPTDVVQRMNFVLATPDIGSIIAAFEAHYKHSAEFEELVLTGAPRVLDDN